jgi:hypothetical protein
MSRIIRDHAAGVRIDDDHLTESIRPTDNDGAFAEVELGFTEDVALAEAGRCLLCVCQARGACTLQKLSIEYGAGTKVYRGKEAWTP